MTKNNKLFARNIFNSAVKDLRKNRKLPLTVYIIDGDGKKHKFIPKMHDVMDKIIADVQIKHMCKELNATCVIWSADTFIGTSGSNVPPSLDPMRKEAIYTYYEDISKQHTLIQKYHRTRRNKIVLIGKVGMDEEVEGRRFTNLLQRPEKYFPLVVNINNQSEEVLS